MHARDFRTLAFLFMLAFFEYVATVIVEKLDARGGWARVAARHGEAVSSDSPGNRVAIRLQKTLVFTSAALTAVAGDFAVSLIVRHLGIR